MGLKITSKTRVNEDTGKIIQKHYDADVVAEDNLGEIRERANAIIKKYRDNPPADLAHFVRQCESSQALEEEGLKDD